MIADEDNGIWDTAEKPPCFDIKFLWKDFYATWFSCGVLFGRKRRGFSLDREEWFSFGDNVDEAVSAAEEILSDSLLELEREGKEISHSTTLDKIEVKHL